MATNNRNTQKSSLSARARSAYSGARDKIENTKDNAEDFIKRKPFTSVGIAAGAGVLIGAAIALGTYRAYENRRKNSIWDRLTSWF